MLNPCSLIAERRTQVLKRNTQNASSETQITFSQNATPKRNRIARGAHKTQIEVDQNANSKRKCHLDSKMEP